MNSTENATNGTDNSTKSEKEIQNDISAEKIKESVKNETDQLEKQRNQKNEILKNENKPVKSDSVDPEN